jgi:hypothetical protein
MHIAPAHHAGSARDREENSPADQFDQPRTPKSEEQFDAEWREKYGEEGAALIRKTVNANMADYLFLKQFAMKV